MPSGEEHAVTDEMTYFDTGIDVLSEDIAKIKEKYGPDLGIGYHHFSTLYHVYSGVYPAEIIPAGLPVTDTDSNTASPARMQNPGYLLLSGEDGSRIIASPYRTDLRTGTDSYSWFVAGAKEHIAYTVQYYDLFQSISLPGKLYFHMQENGFRLEAPLP